MSNVLSPTPADFFYQVYNLLVNNVGRFDDERLLLSTPARLWETLACAGSWIGWSTRAALLQDNGFSLVFHHCHIFDRITVEKVHVEKV